jgi:hypothetical protein
VRIALYPFAFSSSTRRSSALPIALLPSGPLRRRDSSARQLGVCTRLLAAVREEAACSTSWECNWVSHVHGMDGARTISGGNTTTLAGVARRVGLHPTPLSLVVVHTSSIHLDALPVEHQSVRRIEREAAHTKHDDLHIRSWLQGNGRTVELG